MPAPRPVAWSRALAPVPLFTTAELLAHLRLIPDGAPETHPDAAYVDGLGLAATARLDGITGLLCAAINTQVWAFDYLADDLRDVSPVAGIVALSPPITGLQSLPAPTWTTTAGAVPLSLTRRGGGLVFALPATLPALPDTVTITATYETTDPARRALIKQAALLLVGTMYESRETDVIGTTSSVLPAAQRIIDTIRTFDLDRPLF